MSAAALRRLLAPTGSLRCGINMANPLLVTSADADGLPLGVAPDLAGDIAAAIGVPLVRIPFDTPGELTAAALEDVWDLCFVGSEPVRAEVINFTEAYVGIEATYLVPPGSPLKNLADVDKPGVRIAVMENSAYDLYLSRSLAHAELVRAPTIDASFEIFLEQQLDAYACLRTRLDEDAEKLPGCTIMDGGFTSVQQAAGVPRRPGWEAAAAFVFEFIETAKANGRVAELVEAHDVVGKLVVEPPASTEATEVRKLNKQRLLLFVAPLCHFVS